MTVSSVWVYADVAVDKPLTITLELLTKARALGNEVGAVYAGANVDAIAPVLAAHGAAKIYATGDLGDRLAGPAVSGALAALVAEGRGPDMLLFGQTYEGRDIVSRLSVKIDRTVLTNNIDLAADGGTVRGTTAIFGGNTLVTTEYTGPGPHLAVVRPKSFSAEPGGAGAGEVVTIAVPDPGATGAARVTGRHVEASSGPKLDEANIVVSGGRGLGEAGKYQMIEELAKLLKGAPGASRAIVDAGWVPYSYQVGQTGKVVKPSVYLACGISGATQHMVGMKGAKNIIAINKDKEAPIFSIADLGIVGDVHKVLPKLIEALRARG